MTNAILDAFYSLGKSINKRLGNEPASETEEGIVSEKFPELKLDMTNDELSKLTQKWERTWKDSEVYSEAVKHGDENENYWLGKQFQQAKVDKSRALVDNVIFEALETYIPQIIRHNPEPVVTLRAGEKQTPENLAFASNLKNTLGDLADELKMRLKLKKAGRHWAIYLLGVAKFGWDMDRDIPSVKIIRGRKLILDPEATVDEDGYTGEYLGEHRKLQASTMLNILENIGGEKEAGSIINELVKENLGTQVGFIEWWTDQYMCWTIDSKVLLKKKNPHWNYDTENQTEAPADATTGETPLDSATGQPMMDIETVPGFNHLPTPKKPYLFLSIFNLGKQPVDDTSLIGQNLSNQDLINKRVKQIDKNADSMNGGMVVSLERSGLTQQQAKGVTEALRKGGTIAIPAGAVNEAVARMSAPALPTDVYMQLQDTRNRTRDIFGTRGSSFAGMEGDKTVRGKLQGRQLDTDRIGGGISEYVEQFADDIYNYLIQLLYVYDDQYAAGGHPKVQLTVKEGSMLPKDSLAMANQAVELAGGGKMSLLDLYKKLEYPNAEEMAANVWLEVNAPEILFANDPRVQQVIQARQAAAGAANPPSESISFKDLPPEGKAQMAKQAGIELHPEAIAAYDENQATAEAERSKPVQPELKKENQPTQ